MNFVKIGDYHINVDRITHVEAVPSGELHIYFGNHNTWGGITPGIILDQHEAPIFLEFLRSRATLLGKDVEPSHE